MKSYRHYFLLNEFLQGLVFFIWGLISLGISILYFCQNCLPKKIKRCIDCVNQCLKPILEHLFSIMLKSYIDHNGRKTYRILNYKVPKIYLLVLSVTVFNLTGVALVQFWEDFLFEESRICSTDPNLGCFPSNPNLTTPRLDCSNTSYLEDNNITSIVCYRFAYKLGTATGSALGIMTTTALIISINTITFLKISKGNSELETTLKRKLCTVIIQLILTVALFTATIFLSILQTDANSSGTKRYITWMKNLYILYTMIVYNNPLFSWYLFKKEKKDNDEREPLIVRTL